jgi:hypothetical protein
MIQRSVPRFLPSVHGLRFANAFAPGPTVRLGLIDPRAVGIGDASAGLCGGMALTARDLWAAGVPAPCDTQAPANGGRRFRALVRRQVQSLDWLRVPLQYAVLAVLHPERAFDDGPRPSARGIVASLRRDPVRVPTVRREWLRVRAELDAGRPCLLELIRVGGFTPAALVRNHQVLAWGYAADAAGCADTATLETEGGTIRLQVYDPNHPGDDRVELELTIAPDEGDGRPLPERIALRQTTGEPLLGFFRGPCPPNAPVGAWR